MGSVESSKVIFYISTSKQDFRISDGREVVKINRQRNPFMPSYSSGTEPALSRLSGGVSTHTGYLHFQKIFGIILLR